MWLQRRLTLQPRTRGFHLITEEVVAQLPELAAVNVGLAHLQLLHTSASLSLNENAASAVRRDLESYLNQLVPEGLPYIEHVEEGPDDMPAHIKSGLLGVQLSLPITQGSFALGTWQGIYLGEHRNHGGARQLLVTLQGDAD